MKRETVVFYEPVGYQRNGVSDAFYHEFLPDDVTCSQQRVKMIHDSILPEGRDDFRQQFLDNWDRDRSFVLISY
jgi:hypothetical protein